jgi:hypothetical protein
MCGTTQTSSSGSLLAFLMKACGSCQLREASRKEFSNFAEQSQPCCCFYVTHVSRIDRLDVAVSQYEYWYYAISAGANIALREFASYRASFAATACLGAGKKAQRPVDGSLCRRLWLILTPASSAARQQNRSPDRCAGAATRKN